MLLRGCLFRQMKEGKAIVETMTSPQPPAPSPTSTTLGILAGGNATRLGGIDKAWLQRDGTPLVLALVRRLASEVDATLVSANRNFDRYRERDLRVVEDRITGIGPLGGLDALAHACTTPWLLTLPIDVVCVNECLLRSLRAAGGQGASAEDDDGPQPLVALWPVPALREAAADAIAEGDFAVHALQSRLGMARVRFDGVRYGNLNTLGDLAAAGIAS